MSIWYHLDVTVIAKDKSPVAKFFGLDDDWKDVRTDTFKFSFGGKNAPSLALRKVVQQNPDLIFLVKQEVECDTVEWFVTRWDTISDQQQFFWIQSFGEVTKKISKKLLEEYNQDSPTLVSKHLEGQKGFENFRWEMFFNDFDKAADRLKHAEDYKEMVNPWKHFNIKNYLIEYECDYGHPDDGPFWHKEWQGPHPLGKIESIKADIAERLKDGRMKEGGIRNISVREVEPR